APIHRRSSPHSPAGRAPDTVSPAGFPAGCLRFAGCAGELRIHAAARANPPLEPACPEFLAADRLEFCRACGRSPRMSRRIALLSQTVKESVANGAALRSALLCALSFLFGGLIGGSGLGIESIGGVFMQDLPRN